MLSSALLVVFWQPLLPFLFAVISGDVGNLNATLNAHVSNFFLLHEPLKMVAPYINL
jgi:hypothetical protein